MVDEDDVDARVNGEMEKLSHAHKCRACVCFISQVIGIG
jgi:hypothetical protein